MMKKAFYLISLSTVTATLFFFYTTESNSIPKVLNDFIQEQHVLPKYVEAYYSPLGRSPVVDAVLGDPFYLPIYAITTGKQLRESSHNNSLYDVYTSAILAGGIPVIKEKSDFLLANPSSIPQEFLSTFGQKLGREVYCLWQTFIFVYREAESALSGLTPEEKTWIYENREAFFFGHQGANDYDFFTTDSEMPLKFFELSSRVDLAKLAECAQHLCLIVDSIYELREAFRRISIDHNFVWEEQRLKFIAAGKFDEFQQDSADFFIDLGGSHIHTHNAGGTEGKRAAALFVDLAGNHMFIGKNAVQGSGILGIGVFANFGGNNSYQAETYSQGAGFFGAGIMMNLAGNNTYEMDFFGQSCAAFGSSLLWDKKGNDHYLARQGMAQAASSTLGVAFLLNNEGGNSYDSGISGSGSSRFSGMGQGGSIGTRNSVWFGHPSFYGGVSFLYDVEGTNDTFWTPWLGQGSSYFLGLGVLMVGPGDANFRSDVDAQGQGLHLSAGLLLKEGGNDHYSGGWGSLGTGGDRSVGMFIDTGGNDIVEGSGHSVGSARKPKALGVFIKILGNTAYTFKDNSNANIQKPMTPEEWPSALFLDLNGTNTYPEGVDHLKRCNNCQWNVGNHGIGIDTDLNPKGLIEAVFDKFPKKPRIAFSFDPIKGWKNNVAYRPLPLPKTPEELNLLIQEVPKANYDRRRQIYEILDLWRFKQGNAKVDVSSLLQDFSNAPEDQLNFAFLWGLLDHNLNRLQDVMNALEQQTISSAYARKMAIRFVGYLGWDQSINTLAKVIEVDPSEENRANAALMLAKFMTPGSLNLLEPALKSPSERVAYAAAAGLKDSPIPGALDAVIPLLDSESIYVRRAAALTAISLNYKPAIPIFLSTLSFNTLDTENNYGDNLYNQLAPYVGVDFGVDRNAWLEWWKQVHETFEFPSESEKKQLIQQGTS